jgi:predicted component of type VI protein secretion system
MTETLTRSREWLLLNAVEAWLYHYKDSGTPTVAQYQELQREFHDAYMQTLSMDVVERREAPAEPTPTRTTSTRKGKTNGSQSSAKAV